MPTFEGKTIEVAIRTGLASLNLPQEAVQIDVLEDGKRGFLGFGAKPARVQMNAKSIVTEAENGVATQEAVAVTTTPEVVLSSEEQAAKDEEAAEVAKQQARKRLNEAALDAVQTYLETSISALGIQATMQREHIRGGVLFQIDADKDALLIGKHGKTINALQFLAQTLFNHEGRAKWTVMLNVGDYRQRREDSVRRLAERTAHEVLASGKSVYLDAMPSFERKAIHHELQDNPYATTRSEGTEPHRYVVVVPKR